MASLKMTDEILFNYLALSMYIEKHIAVNGSVVHLLIRLLTAEVYRAPNLECIVYTGIVCGLILESVQWGAPKYIIKHLLNEVI